MKQLRMRRSSSAVVFALPPCWQLASIMKQSPASSSALWEAMINDQATREEEGNNALDTLFLRAETLMRPEVRP